MLYKTDKYTNNPRDANSRIATVLGSGQIRSKDIVFKHVLVELSAHGENELFTYFLVASAPQSLRPITSEAPQSLRRNRSAEKDVQVER